MGEIEQDSEYPKNFEHLKKRIGRGFVRISCSREIFIDRNTFCRHIVSIIFFLLEFYMNALTPPPPPPPLNNLKRPPPQGPVPRNIAHLQGICPHRPSADRLSRPNTETEAEFSAFIASPLPLFSTPELNIYDHRTHMVMFTIETDAGEVECRMGIRAKDGTSEPTPDDIRNSSAAIVRKVTTNPIKVFLSFHMDTDLFDDETAWDDGGGTVTLDAAMIDQARLQPATDYVLYGVLEGG